MLVLLSCSKDNNITEEPQQPIETKGYNMLLIGNSFFRPYADKLDGMAIDAGFINHNSTIVFRGGSNGRAINLWNDSTSAEHNLIKSTLDQGNIDCIGMTSGFDPDNSIEGFTAWIEYALQNNPDITIFISIAPFDYPFGNANGTRSDWVTTAADNGFNSIQEMYEFYISDIQHNTIVDQLRIEFPSTKIFTIPTGWATFNLYQMHLDNQLLDTLTMTGPRATSIFTDAKGHQGDIVRETGGLIWLSSIYNVDLDTNTYQTGFNTDIHQIAKQIRDSHDSNYNKCIDGVASINEISNSIVNIFPNPASDVINIEAEDKLDFEATLYDLYGRKIYTTANNSQINIASVPAGLYLLEIKDVNLAKGVFEKIMIKR